MRLSKMKSGQLLKLLKGLLLQESELESSIRLEERERERIAVELKERGYLAEDISDITRLELTEVEVLKTNRLRELIHYELQKSDKLRSKNETSYE